jgi:hypothetical protein
MEHFTGTKAVAASHAFDVAALQAHLLQHLPGFAGPLSVEQFKGGQSNPTYKLITPGCAYVMRTKPGPAARLLPSAHAVEREFRVMKARWPAPACRWRGCTVLCEDEAVIGRAFYVMEFMDGRVLWDQALPGMTPAQRAAHYDEMNRVMAALHGVDVAAVGLADYGKPGNYFERQIGRWSKQFLASITEPIAEMHKLIEWLPAHIPARGHGPGAGVGGAWRLPARQPRVRQGRAAHPGGAGLGAFDAGPPAGRLQLPLHGLAHPARACSAASAGWTCRRWAFRQSATTWRATANAPAAATLTR